MSLRLAFSVVLAGALLSACVVVPVTIASYDPDCQVVTHHMELQAVQVGAISGCSNQGCAALVLAATGVTAVSAIISGSIVVIGNVGYWAERRAGCVAPPAAPPAPLT
jgi:predicted small integral membrane protein